jgi:serine/threonine protein kinase
MCSCFFQGANIVLDQSGRNVKLCDFGAASKMASASTMPGEFHSTHGTPAFMAPEVIRGEAYGRSADIWSLGCCVVEMASFVLDPKGGAFSFRAEALIRGMIR